MLSLKLRQNGKFDYETRALEQGAGGLQNLRMQLSETAIENQNRLFLDEAAYLAAVDEMCLKYYSEYEQAHNAGFSARSSRAGVKRRGSRSGCMRFLAANRSADDAARAGGAQSGGQTMKILWATEPVLPQIAG